MMIWIRFGDKLLPQKDQGYNSFYLKLRLEHLIHSLSNHIHQNINNFYLQILCLIYITPPTCRNVTINVKLRITTASRNSSKFIIRTIISICLYSVNILSQVCITEQFCVMYYCPDFHLCCVKLDDYISKIN